ncbi:MULTISPECIES: galactarate dehydratase [unclassified Undibacterium]|uniref:galactarate dehydratase n=1 Tax=unclassified Undibacterium TaxID=2630295 RepID=UPI002AC8E545|nr:MULTISPECIES: galactarate dehydratase [unclassified Undibacterium]MEB0137658.1 galactarate dehydratase [Undibacterium sp. CCC2.1]MEB0172690.1 galactarate dehydratase [Undibacterium sp. CCC1.1]MEB0177392.1 galactarate dehydratase [Undibacterium sp. CCC3.4]MEB0215485.1 galactarate dehydratase [Undibacterium sp. 5I2]WPX42234.1 galactarate dehydratase [Undibacterium sp. CCC3.4]
MPSHPLSVSTPSRPLYIRMHANDNVAIVVNDGGLPAGTEFPGEFVLTTRIPQGHKIALRQIAEGAPIIRYDVVIGHAMHTLEQGSWVEESAIRMPPARELDGLPIANRPAPVMPALEGYTFEGYRNADGSVATRNILAITTTVQCVAGVVEHAVKRIKAELLPQYPNVDDVIGLEHTYGCGVAIDAPNADIPIRTLRNISLNPNFGGQAMVVSLGCEKLQPARLLPEGAIPIQNGPYIVTLQDDKHVGFESMITSIMEMATVRLAALNLRTRETCSAAELVVGVQCGGSDAFSGVTANPAVGYATDLLVRAGATVMFSETTEVRDGIDQLTSRAINAEVAQAMIAEMAWYDNYLKQGGVDRSANTTPGNKKGGLSNIVEKAMGSIVKSGSSAISGVLSPGQKVRQKGLIYAATPASDFICGTLQLAAGMNLHIFTTGRGTPYGLAAVPVIKVATRDDLAKRWHDLMDVNAGRIATGAASIEQVGWELFELMLAVASGKKTWAEHWKLHNALTLFNPAPVT